MEYGCLVAWTGISPQHANADKYPTAWEVTKKGASDFADAIFDGFVNAIKTIGNTLYHPFVDTLRYPHRAYLSVLGEEARAEAIDSIKYQFIQDLDAIHTAPTASSSGYVLKKNEKELFWSRQNLLSLLAEIPPTECTTELSTYLSSHEGALSIEEWAFVSLKFDAMEVDAKRQIQEQNHFHQRRFNRYCRGEKKYYQLCPIQKPRLHQSGKIYTEEDGSLWMMVLDAETNKFESQQLDRGWSRYYFSELEHNENNVKSRSALPRLKEASRELDDLEANLRRSEFVLKNVQHLAFKTRLAWAHLAHEAIIDQLATRYDAEWDQAATASATCYGLVGADVGLTQVATVGGRVSVGYTKRTLIDDEYNNVLLEVVNVKTSVVAKMSAFFAELTGEGSKTKSLGRFAEWSSAREYATYQFESLISEREHRNNPDIARFLSRKNTLNSSGLMMDLITGDEVLEIGQLKEKNDLEEKTSYMKKQLSILTTAVEQTEIKKNQRELDLEIETINKTHTQEEAKKKADELNREYAADLYEKMPSAVQSDEESSQHKDEMPGEFFKINIAQADVIKAGAEIDTWNGTVAASAGLKVDGVDLAKMGVAASASLQHEHMVLDVNRFTPYCKRLHNKLKTPAEKADIASVLATQFFGMKDKFVATWKKDEQIIDDNHFTTTVCLLYLQKDFEFLCSLHVRAVSGERTAQAEINRFLIKYGVENKGQLLRNMVLFNAHLFSLAKFGDDYNTLTRSTDNYPITSTEEQTSLEEKMLAFEAELLSPPFKVEQTFWKEQAQFREDIDFEVYDKKFNFTVKGGIDGVDYAASAKIELAKVELLVRERFHTNPLRSGHYIDVTLGLVSNLPAVGDLIQAISLQMQGKVPEGFENQLKKAIENAKLSGEGVLHLRFFKPHSMPELGYKHLFTRNLFNRDVSLHLEVPISIAPLVDFVVGGGYATSSSKCLTEQYSTDTVLYFAMRYMHDCGIGKIDSTDNYWKTIVREQREALEKLFLNYGREQMSVAREDALLGKIKKLGDKIKFGEVYADVVKEAEEVALKARELFDRLKNTPIPPLAEEMQVMGRYVQGNSILTENEKDDFADAVIQFNKSTKIVGEFHHAKKKIDALWLAIDGLNKMLETELSDADKVAVKELKEEACTELLTTRQYVNNHHQAYDACLADFQAVLRAYFPHFAERKENSAIKQALQIFDGSAWVAVRNDIVPLKCEDSINRQYENNLNIVEVEKTDQDYYMESQGEEI